MTLFGSFFSISFTQSIFCQWSIFAIIERGIDFGFGLQKYFFFASRVDFRFASRAGVRTNVPVDLWMGEHLSLLFRKDRCIGLSVVVSIDGVVNIFL